MKKAIKFIIGMLALLLMFLTIDGSGIGLKEKYSNVKSWATGESKKLKIL